MKVELEGWSDAEMGDKERKERRLMVEEEGEHINGEKGLGP